MIAKKDKTTRTLSHVQILIKIVVTMLTLSKLVLCSMPNKNHITSRSHRNSKQVPQSKLDDINILRNKCNESEANLDKCSAQLIAFGESSILFPENIQDLNSVFCPNLKKTYTCIKNSTDCYRPFERQIINWVLSSTRKLNYKRCKNEDEKQKFLKLTNSCFSLMKHPADKCMTSYIASLEGIADLNKLTGRLTEDDILIQLSCCANRRFKQCVMDNAKQQCKPMDSLKKLKRTNSVSSHRMAQRFVQRAMQDMMEDLKVILDGMALTGPEFICSSVDEKFCRTKYDGRFNGRTPRHKSIIPAMIKIYSNH